jgi:hypothetical protein
MKRLLVATLMAVVFGLFSMPAVQAVPNNGWAVGAAINSDSPIQQAQFRVRRRRRFFRHRFFVPRRRRFFRGRRFRRRF